MKFKNTLKHIRTIFTILFTSIVFFSYSQSHDKYTQIADSLIQKEKFDELISYFNQELMKYPKNENVLRWLGYSYIAINNLELGEKYYKEALTINPKCARCYLNIGKIYSLKGEHKKGIEMLNKAIELDPNDDYLYSIRAHVKEAMGDVFGTLFDLNKAIEMAPNNYDYYIQRGNYNSIQSYKALAISDYNKAIEINPEYYYAYFQRASIFYDQHNYEQALTDINIAIKLDSNQYSLYVGRGAIFESLKEFSKAIDDYNKAISLNKNDYLPYLNRASSNYKLENIDLSCDDYLILNEIINTGLLTDSEIINEIHQSFQDICDSSKVSYYYQRGIGFYNLGNFQKSIEFYSKGLSKFPNSSILPSFLGNAYMATFDYRNAIDNYLLSNKNKDNIAIEVRQNPKFSESSNSVIEKYQNVLLATNYYSLSECYYNLQQYDEALKFINLAFNYAKNNNECKTEAYYNLRGLIYIMNENFELAIADFDKSLQINKDFELAYINRAIAKVSIIEKVKSNTYTVRGNIKNQIIAVNWNSKHKSVSKNHESSLISAINDCSTAIEINNKNGYGFYIRGQIKKLLNYNDYCIDLLTAKSLGLIIDDDILKKCLKTEK